MKKNYGIISGIVAVVVIFIVFLFVHKNEEYTVTFDTVGGTIIEQVKVKKGTTIGDLEVPTKEGYTFLYWILDGKVCSQTDKILKDIKLTAKWEENKSVSPDIKTYTVIFDSNGGSTIHEVEVEEGNIVEEPNLPIKEGYVFVEWMLNNKTFDFNTTITKDITLVAKWEKVEEEIKTYTVTFNTDGGSEVSSKTVIEGNKVSKPSNPTRPGYTFVMWTLNDKEYNFNSKVTSNITLKATWRKVEDVDKEVTYQVRFDLNGGSGNISSQTINEGETAKKPIVPVKEGSTFLGWYLEDSWYSFSNVVTEDITLVAYWDDTQKAEVALIKYETNSSGKWIFINNPESLYLKNLTENNGGKAIYSNFINGEAEIYFEHYIKENASAKGNYAIRFYNPSSTSQTLTIHKCGSTIVRGDGDRYIDTWEEYYGYRKCALVGQTYTIAPFSSQYIFLNTYATGSNWSDYESYLSTTPPSTKIPTSVIDGVVRVSSSGKLHVETYFYQDLSSIPSKSYDHSDNDLSGNESVVYSGYYSGLPNVKASITFEIDDDTQIGNLPVAYNKGNTSNRDVWYTHTNGAYAPYENAYI